MKIDAEERAIDPLHLRAVLGGFATGVTVVTTAVHGEYHGMTANSLTSVSLDPPLLLVCFVRNSRTATAVFERNEFVVNILDESQAMISHRFARPGEDHFTDIATEEDDHGLPLLPGGVGYLSCVVHAVHDGGDHHIVVARIRRAVTAPRDPLVFFRARYRRLLQEDGEYENLWYA